MVAPAVSAARRSQCFLVSFVFCLYVLALEALVQFGRAELVDIRKRCRLSQLQGWISFHQRFSGAGELSPSHDGGCEGSAGKSGAREEACALSNKLTCIDRLFRAFFSSTLKCRPFYTPREFTAVLITAVYIPLRANAKQALEELHTAMSSQLNAHPAGIVIVAGDFNHVDSNVVFSKFSKNISFPTRDTNTLD